MSINLAQLAIVFVLGVLAGGIINEIVARLPIYLYRQWQGDAREVLGLPEDERPTPHYNHHQPKSRRMTIGISCGLLAVGVALHFSLSMEGLAFITLTWSLIALSLIDADHKILPDVIVLPLLWAGLIVNSFGFFTTASAALWGAIGGYMVLWVVHLVFRLATGREGIGHGDFKLVSALGAWGGWQILPLTVFLAAVLGILSYVVCRTLSDEPTAGSKMIPFGPYLSAAGWIVMVYTMLAP